MGQLEMVLTQCLLMGVSGNGLSKAHEQSKPAHLSDELQILVHE